MGASSYRLDVSTGNPFLCRTPSRHEGRLVCRVEIEESSQNCVSNVKTISHQTGIEMNRLEIRCWTRRSLLIWNGFSSPGHRRHSLHVDNHSRPHQCDDPVGGQPRQWRRDVSGLGTQRRGSSPQTQPIQHRVHSGAGHAVDARSRNGSLERLRRGGRRRRLLPILRRGCEWKRF